MAQPIVLQRYGAPNKFDHFPQGTVCRVTSEGRTDVYEQISQDSESPIWELKDPIMVQYTSVTLLEKNK